MLGEKKSYSKRVKMRGMPTGGKKKSWGGAGGT